MKILITIILATNLFLVQGQEYIKFFKVSSPSITQKVKLGAFVKIILNCEKNDSLAKYDYIRGYLTKIHNDTLVIKYNTLCKYHYYEKESRRDGQISQLYDQKLLSKKIAVENIAEIDFHNKTNKLIYDASGVLIFISSVTALIIAPLISINYKYQTFNEERYFNWVKVSLIGLTVSIPLSIISKPKKVQINNLCIFKKRPLWKYKK
ncbi:MAG: hypothetical protein KAT33_09675 [Bacteroidales bacterium]|nr:hypothetical protein [Bacteroidales bacterium]